jgi:hypothetical protein
MLPVKGGEGCTHLVNLDRMLPVKGEPRAQANGPCCEGVGDSKIADLIHRGWERWSQICNRAPARSQHEERPERRKVKADILERISLPRGAGLSAREEGGDECVCETVCVISSGASLEAVEHVRVYMYTAVYIYTYTHVS